MAIVISMVKINHLSVLKPFKVKATHSGQFDYVGSTNLLKASDIYNFLDYNTDLGLHQISSYAINSSNITEQVDRYYNRITCYENIHDFLSILPPGNISLQVKITDDNQHATCRKSKLTGDLYNVTLSGRSIMILDPDHLERCNRRELPDHREQQWLIKNVPIIAVLPRQIVHVECDPEGMCNMCITTVKPKQDPTRIVISAMVINSDNVGNADYLSNYE